MPTYIKPLTAAQIERILRREYPAGTFVRDPTLIGFGVRTGSTRASYIVEARIGRGGRPRRQTIGTVGKIKLDEAKNRARELLTKMAHGIDVVAEHRETIAAIARSDAKWTDPLKVVIERRTLKPRTLHDYTRAIQDAGLEGRRLRDLTEQGLARIYRDLGQGAHASRTLRCLRTLWNVARADDPHLLAFPIQGVKAANRSWAATRRRRRVIADALLPAWWRAVTALPRSEIRDLIAFLLFTGCRLGESRNLRAGDVDLRAGVMTFKDTKSGRDVELPIVKQLVPVLKRRLAQLQDDGALFPQADVHNVWKSTLAVAVWSPHDLRRGFVSACHRVGIDETVARALTGHANEGDAHTGYVILPPDALREHAQEVADYLDRKLAGKVVTLRRAA